MRLLRTRFRSPALAAGFAALVLAVAAIAGAAHAAAGSTVWLCKPGLANDPCTSSLTATVVKASGLPSLLRAQPTAATRFDCFYVYPTVSSEPGSNADLRVQKAETDVAVVQAARFSQVCRVHAPMYRQVTSAAVAKYPKLNLPASYGAVAYASILAGFNDYLAHYNDGRPIVLIGHSQGAAMLIRLLEQRFDHNAALRKRLLLAIILGGDVEVRTGTVGGGSFNHIPLCTKPGQAGCVIAYSSFPSQPPATSLFGRPGQGVAQQSNQGATAGLQVACVNPAALGGGTSPLDTFVPSEGLFPTPWVELPGLYTASCQTGGGATWLQVAKTAASDRRPSFARSDGANWGYHSLDVNLALGNLVADTSAAERTWKTRH